MTHRNGLGCQVYLNSMHLHTSSQSCPHGCQSLSDFDDSIRDRSDIEIQVSGRRIDGLSVDNGGDLYAEAGAGTIVVCVPSLAICELACVRRVVIGVKPSWSRSGSSRILSCFGSFVTVAVTIERSGSLVVVI
jgi:hypothetical protein